MDKLKNLIPHLKHMWKDPINTIEEADARKKEIMPWLYGSIGVAVLGCGLSSLLGFLMIFGLIGIVGVMAFGFMLFVIKKAKEKFAALTCVKCNNMAKFSTPEEYAAHVKCGLVTHEATYHGISHPASNNGVVSEIRAKGSASAVVSIDLKCPHCGNVKKLEYALVPFKCSYVEKKVLVKDVELVKMRLENAVKEVVEDYNDSEKNAQIPYTIHSKRNPNYENRAKPQVGTVGLKYKGVTIDYRKDVVEMVDAFFLENQLDGTIIDPSEPKKSK